MMQTDDPGKIHSLGILRDNDCWSVFLQHVVDEGNSVFKSEAVRFRDKILDKCKGLPLTAKLLAGLLRGESLGQGWEAILNSSIWDDEFPGRKEYRMPPVVMLSYFHLPPHLKPCFSYCFSSGLSGRIPLVVAVILHILGSLSGLKILICRRGTRLRNHLNHPLFLPGIPIPNLGKLASEFHKLTSVSEVEIWGCNMLPSELHNLTSLSELEIWDCDMLEKLPSELHNLTSLRRLHISHCRRLSCIWEMGFPSTMESLVIWECQLLACLSPSPSSSAHSLKRLDISSCKNLESFVATADSFPSLESLQIDDCPKLKVLPEGIHRRLKVMSIEGCQSLEELSISVHHLPALETLRISGTPVIPTTMTPDDEPLFSVPLPSSLTTLRIRKFKNLSPEAFQNLTSLQYLSIFDCPELTSIPHQLLPSSLLELKISDCPGLTSIPDHSLPPSSLRTINIWGCPGLTSIPEQFLPPSLLVLKISGCPLLDPDFTEGKGRYWPKVKFIPCVQFN